MEQCFHGGQRESHAQNPCRWIPMHPLDEDVRKEEIKTPDNGIGARHNRLEGGVR